MNRPFWSLRRAETDSCESIEPLLSLYADRMASAEEMRRIKAHLPICEGCREAFSWMQATHRALAARPVVLPPADLHSRIAQAIAAASAPRTPGVLRAARSFRLRPAYAAAASLTVVGLVLSLSHPLWNTASQTGIKPAPRPAPFVAAVPSADTPKPALPRRVRVHPSQTGPQIASAARATENPAARPVLAPRKAVPVSATAPNKQVAAIVRVLDPRPVPAPVETARPLAVVPHDKIASAKTVLPEQRQPAEKALPIPRPLITPKLPDVTVVARHDKEPPPVPVKIAPSVVVEQAPPPVRTASAQPRPKSDDPMAKLAESLKAMQSTPYARSPFTVRQASSSLAATAAHALDSSDHPAFYGAIYSGTAAK